MKKILVVDDIPELRENISEILQGADYAVATAATGMEAIKRAQAEHFDVVLLDMVMPGLKGIDVLVTLRKKRPKTKVIMITAFATVQGAVDAIQKGASDYITKPFKIEELLSVVGRVIEEARFTESIEKVGLDDALNSLSNPIRRNIFRLLEERTSMRLMEITRELNIEDHTKIVFHLKNLREASMVEQKSDKSYVLTPEGRKILEALSLFEQRLSD